VATTQAGVAGFRYGGIQRPILSGNDPVHQQHTYNDHQSDHHHQEDTQTSKNDEWNATDDELQKTLQEHSTQLVDAHSKYIGKSYTQSTCTHFRKIDGLWDECTESANSFCHQCESILSYSTLTLCYSQTLLDMLFGISQEEWFNP
jgi:hypothetical protein